MSSIRKHRIVKRKRANKLVKKELLRKKKADKAYRKQKLSSSVKA
jgi:hypothetical protein